MPWVTSRECGSRWACPCCLTLGCLICSATSACCCHALSVAGTLPVRGSSEAATWHAGCQGGWSVPLGAVQAKEGAHCKDWPDQPLLALQSKRPASRAGAGKATQLMWTCKPLYPEARGGLDPRQGQAEHVSSAELPSADIVCPSLRQSGAMNLSRL